MARAALLRFVCIAVIAFAVGWWMHGFAMRPVHAETSRSLGSASQPVFELSGVGRDTALTVYSSDTHTLYVYPAVTQGSSTVNCEFMLHLGRAGEPVQRSNCSPGQLLP